MLRLISRLVFRLKGWHIVGEIPPDIKKCVIVQAPHTSYLDFFIGWHASNILRYKFRFMIKKEAFVFLLGHLLKAAGGVPVDRLQPGKTIKQLVERFKNAESFYLAITPEGTRKRNDNWKKGFYTIATAANVPILLGYVDYKKRTCGIGDLVIHPSGDFEKDFEKIKKFYKGMHGRFPEDFNLYP